MVVETQFLWHKKAPRNKRTNEQRTVVQKVSYIVSNPVIYLYTLKKKMITDPYLDYSTYPPDNPSLSLSRSTLIPHPSLSTSA